MKQVVKEAIAAGALGFSTSRTLAHLAIDGEPVPGTYATEDELFGIGSAMGELGAGVFELAPAGTAGEDIISPKKEMDWMRRLSAAIHRPVTFAMVQVDDAPDLWRELMEESLRAVSEGADLWPQVAGRGFGLLSGHFTTYSLFDQIPAYQELKAKDLSPDALVDALRSPEVRHSIESWEPDPATADRMDQAFRTTFVLGSPPDYEPGPERSLTGMAAATGRTPLSMAYDAMLEEDGRGLLYVPILNYSDGDLEPAREMLLHPRSAAGLGDGGAHCGVICDASQPTFMITHWTRDRSRGDRLPLEWMVKKQTHDTARLYGLTDRGTIEVGGGGRPEPDRLRAPADGQPHRGQRSPRRRQPPPAGRHRLRRDHQVRGDHLLRRPGDRRPPRDAAAGRPLTRRPPVGPVRVRRTGHG